MVTGGWKRHVGKRQGMPERGGWAIGQGSLWGQPLAPLRKIMIKQNSYTDWGRKLGISRQRVHQLIKDTEYDSCPKCGKRKWHKAKTCKVCYYLSLGGSHDE